MTLTRYRRLAFALRLRGLDEASVAEALYEAATGESQTGTDAPTSPAAAGTAPEPVRGRTTLSRGLVVIAGCLLLAVLVVQFVSLILWRVDLRLGPVPLFGGMLPVGFGLLVAAFSVEYRLPRGFARRARQLERRRAD